MALKRQTLRELREGRGNERGSEASYRRGAHQTAARIHGIASNLQSREEILDFVGALEAELEKFRYSGEGCSWLLDVAVQRAWKECAA